MDGGPVSNDIKDVPCVPCQQQPEGVVHRCDVPDHCPCRGKHLTEEQIVEDIVNPDMVAFAATFNEALGELKAAVESGTRTNLTPEQAESILTYVKAAAEQWNAERV